MEVARCVDKAGKVRVGRTVDLDLPDIGKDTLPGLRDAISHIDEGVFIRGRKPWGRTAHLGSPAPPGPSRGSRHDRRHGCGGVEALVWIGVGTCTDHGKDRSCQPADG